MPPPLPDRYHLEVRLGRDEDVEEWLATDRVLDRPVLVRLLGPESDAERRGAFLDSVRGAASVTHSHLSAVYAASELEQGAYLVGEWTGAVTFANRLRAGETIPIEEFLPNAAGLAGAVAALHAVGHVHGAIDPGAVSYTQAHPAKLGSFGRSPRYSSQAEEVAALADTLEVSLTGRPPGLAPPSQITDGLGASVDRALQDAREGRLDAAGMADALRAIPSPRPLRAAKSWSWRWLVPASVLVALAIGVTSLGLVLRAPSDSGFSDFLFPAQPAPATPPPPSETTATTLAPPDENAPNITGSFAYDPYGDGTEHDHRVHLAHDGNPQTSWRTERYFSPLPLLKEGVGIGFEVAGSPGTIEFLATEGTSYVLWWSPERRPDLQGWERMASGSTGTGSTRLQVPPREGGVWLLWLVELPQREDGYYTEVYEVTFLP